MANIKVPRTDSDIIINGDDESEYQLESGDADIVMEIKESTEQIINAINRVKSQMCQLKE